MRDSIEILVVPHLLISFQLIHLTFNGWKDYKIQKRSEQKGWKLRKIGKMSTFRF